MKQSPPTFSRFRLALALASLALACGGPNDPSLSQATASDGTAGSAGTGASGDAATTARAMGIGVNIGNTLDNTAAWETGWGQPLISEAFINGLASHGIKTVRVPVAWDTYAVNGVIEPSKMARVHQVVEWIVAAGMYAVVNIHWDGGWINNQSNANKDTLTDDVRSKFTSYWTQIAAAFADVGDQLIFEDMNEEGLFYVAGSASTTPDYAPLNELNQTFVATVRAGGGSNASRNLLIAGFSTDIDLTCVDAFSIPSDPAGAGKLLLSVHYYVPVSFCILAAPANYYGDVWIYPATTWGTAAEESELATQLDKLKAFCSARNIPAIIGEFSVTPGMGSYVREPASRTLWMKSVAATALANGMVPVLWDIGGDINRSDGSLRSDFQSAMTQLGY